MSEPHKWGWVDDDGTVHLRLPDGSDVVVGVYAAGDAEAALAFYERKFADLVADARLTAERVQQGLAKPDAAEAAIGRIRSQLEEPSFVGDIAGLNQLLDTLHALAAERRLTDQAEKARVRTESLAAREALSVEAETLAASTQWKGTGDRFKEMLETWKALPRFDKRAEEALWVRFSTARSAFDKARRSHFAELDAQRAAALEAKNELIAQAEQLATSTDWAATSRSLRDLMDKWKAAPRAARGDEDKLWARFRGAQDRFYDARNADLATRDAGQSENQALKEQLAQRAEALLPITEVGPARKALRSILAEWDAVGHVPRTVKPALDARLRTVEDAVAKAERREWQRTDPAMLDRAERTVAGFQTSVAKLERDLQAAQDAGNARKESAIEASLATSRSLLAAAERVLSEYRG